MEKFKNQIEKVFNSINELLTNRNQKLTITEFNELKELFRKKRLGEQITRSDTLPYKLFLIIDYETLNQSEINQVLTKLENDYVSDDILPELEAGQTQNKPEDSNFKTLEVTDIPIYMIGDAGGFTVFAGQTDNETEKVHYYLSKDNRNFFDDKKDNSYAEIITKETILQKLNNKFISKEDKESLFSVLHLYLRALGPRDRSVTTIGIKIPKGVDPSPFMENLAEEAYQVGVTIGALYFDSDDWKVLGLNEFNKRQNTLKEFIQTQFLKYANEQIKQRCLKENKE